MTHTVDAIAYDTNMNGNQTGHLKCVKGYIYSKEDLAINWEHVERYAAAAEKKGYRVLKKRIEDAHHVQLFKGKGGESDYWGFTQKICVMGMGLEGDVTSLAIP